MWCGRSISAAKCSQKCITKPKYISLRLQRSKFCTNKINNATKADTHTDHTTTKLFDSSSSSQSRLEAFKQQLKSGPSLKDFVEGNPQSSQEVEPLNFQSPPYMHNNEPVGSGRKLFVETYGCQMNVSDSEIVMSIMKGAGFNEVSSAEDADVVFLNTCAIREKAEGKIWERLNYLKHLKVKQKKDITVGVLGCMAERLKTKLLESDKLVDIVAGPDAYRDLPMLLAKVDNEGTSAINVILSQDETYADITPVRLNSNGVSAFVSIMRGCNNMCSYCIVPFTRGRERSRAPQSIVDEVKALSDQGYKEVTLLGQNVNSYNYVDETTTSKEPVPLAKGFKTIYKPSQSGYRFTDLLDAVSRVNPEMRIRFTSPHPKDFPDDLLHLIKERPNLCKSLHIPAQSGSTAVLDKMRRGYSREAYLELIDRIKELMPQCAISSDFISGFCGETEADHLDTISLLNIVKYEHAFMFAYSLREKTHAHRNYTDDVPQDVKTRRLSEVIDTFSKNASEKNKLELNQIHLVLVEGSSRRSNEDLFGRSDTNKKVVFPNKPVPGDAVNPDAPKVDIKPGDYVAVKINHTSSHTLRGIPLCKTTLTQFNTMYPHLMRRFESLHWSESVPIHAQRESQGNILQI
mmetsp:Transcript_21629/g.30246  ORF Transcript_21629/g.30246 Transcript_21629/m.30246 type:complete len:631 (+) Transcript_21629:62-1954(+)